MSGNIETSKSIIERAKIVSSKIEDEEIRKRTFALNIAANITAEYLTSLGFAVDTNLSLYRISSFAKNLELADIYVDGIRLDVRVSFDGQMFAVPKIQEKFDANPVAYIVVNFKKGIENVEVIGFVPNSELDIVETNSEYRFYETSILKSIDELKDFLATVDVKQNIYSIVEHEKIKELCFAFIDDEISEAEKIYFIKHIVSCPVCREIFCSTDDFDSIVSHVRNYEELLNDSTLSVLSGNKEEVDVAALANMAFVKNAEEILDEQNVEDLSLLETESNDEISLEEKILSEIEDDSFEAEISNNELTELAEVVDILSETEDPLVLSVENFDSNNLVDVEEVQDFSSIELNDDTLEFNDSENIDVFEEIEEQNEITEGIDESLSDLEQDNIIENCIDMNTENEVSIDDIASGEELDFDESISDINLTTDDNTVVENDVDLLEVVEAQDFEKNDFEENTDFEILEFTEEDSLLEDTNEVNLLSDDNVEVLDEVALEQEEAFLNIEDNDCSIEESEPVENLDFVDDDSKFVQEEEIDVVDENSEEKENIVLEEQSNKNENVLLEEEKSDEMTEDSELEKLLDDDLLALLSENNTEVQPMESMDMFVEEPSAESFEETQIVGADAENNDINEQNDVIESNNVVEQNENIDSLYEDNQILENTGENDFQLAEEPISEQTASMTKRIIVLIALLLLLLGSGVMTFFLNNKSQNNAVDNMATDEEFFDLQENMIAKKDEAPAVSQDINKSMTNSFSENPAAITITKLSWQVNEKLAAEASVKEYLQIAGKNIQINLQNDLSNSSDLNFNNMVKVSMEIAPDNTLKGLQILESSGSDQVDGIIQRSLTNTLKFVSVPKLQDFNSDYFLTLIINF